MNQNLSILTCYDSQESTENLQLLLIANWMTGILHIYECKKHHHHHVSVPIGDYPYPSYSICREHGAYVAYTLVKTSKLLARPPCQNFLELCDLRNILLTGNFPPLKFITVKQIKPQQLGTTCLLIIHFLCVLAY